VIAFASVKVGNQPIRPIQMLPQAVGLEAQRVIPAGHTARPFTLQQSEIRRNAHAP
jgi:hypothetical protein